MEDLNAIDEAGTVGSQDPRLKPSSANQSAALHTRNKSQMQGMNPAQRPTMTDPSRDPFKKIEGVDQSNQKVRGYKGIQGADYTVSETPLINVIDDEEKTGVHNISPRSSQDLAATEKAARAQLNKAAIDGEHDNFRHDLSQMADREPNKFKFTQQNNGDFNLARKEGIATPDPRMNPSNAKQSAALHARSKEDMQGVNMKNRPTIDPSKKGLDPFAPIETRPKKLGEAGGEKFSSAAEEYSALKSKYKKVHGAQWKQALEKHIAKKYKGE